MKIIEFGVKTKKEAKMGTRTIHVCDSCGEEFKGAADTYRISKIVLKSDTFLDGAGDVDYNSWSIELCEDCAKRVVDALEQIANEKSFYLTSIH
jgi:hypothetical protein